MNKILKSFSSCKLALLLSSARRYGRTKRLQVELHPDCSNPALHVCCSVPKKALLHESPVKLFKNNEESINMAQLLIFLSSFVFATNFLEKLVF